MSKHTPGPWTHEFDESRASSGASMKILDDEGVVIAVCYDDECREEANARLMAAAPELLEAAQSLLITWRCSLTDAENDAPTIDQFCEYSQILALEAAIKKAKGEE